MTTRTLSFPPSVLVVVEKGDPAYFHVPDEGALHKVALEILTERLRAGWFYTDPTDDGPPDVPDYTEEKIPELPAKLQAAARRELASYRKRLREYEHELADFEQIRKAVQEHDGVLAWRILRGRSERGYEYERIQLVTYCGRYHA